MGDAFLLKFLLACLTGMLLIVVVTSVAERVSPKLAGFISAWPTTLVAGLFVITLLTDTTTAATAMIVAPTVIAGIVLFVLGYAALRPFGPWIGLAGGIVPWLVCSSIALLLPPQAGWHIAFFTAIYLPAALLCGRFRTYPAPRVRVSNRELTSRAVLAGVMMASIVAATQLSGPLLSGVIVNFPVITCCTFFLLSRRHGAAIIQSMARTMPHGSVGSVGFSITFMLIAAHVGGWTGFGLAVVAGYVVTVGLSMAANRFFSYFYTHAFYQRSVALLSR